MSRDINPEHGHVVYSLFVPSFILLKSPRDSLFSGALVCALVVCALVVCAQPCFLLWRPTTCHGSCSLVLCRKESQCAHLAGGFGTSNYFRLTCYDQEKSTATLTAQHASKDHHVVINTSLVEPFHPIIGAQYLVVGETETAAEVDMTVRARVLTCVDGVNLPLLQKAIMEQRSFFKEREGQQNAT
ncbi:CST complex subunit TEN1 isoform X1 [Nerophis ophidion]|uniref:CST complex subunit TEN1 isoform X1 n=1 Tax=Nerophis ophidion TaxID=159077 RepID=UPI002ADF6586|nr:CST complex subunit TEN1 isoform X1 [Nerophis ophidion]